MRTLHDVVAAAGAHADAIVASCDDATAALAVVGHVAARDQDEIVVPYPANADHAESRLH